jgi:hypothetical protein
MLRLTSQGVAPAEAAAWALSANGVESAASADGVVSAAPADGADSAGPADGVVSAAPADRVVSAAPVGRTVSAVHGRDGGGQAIPLGHVAPAARGLARAAMRLDAPTMRAILEDEVVQHGVIPAWDDVAVPVLAGIGERYQATQRFVEVEHLISRCVSEVLGAVRRPASTPRVLLAAADEEQHTLPLEALAAALAQAGVASRLLGGRVPPRALEDAVTRTGPTAVVLWSHTASTGDAGQLARVIEHPHPPLLLAAGGPGWPAVLPAGVAHLTTLRSAVSLVQAAVG